MRFDLGSDALLTRHSNAVAAGTSTITPANGIYMAGYDSVTFLVLWGTITTSGAQSIEVHSSSDDGDSDSYTALASTKVTVADSDDNKVTYVTVHHPPEDYVLCVVNRATQNSVLDGIVAVQYNGSVTRPVTQGSTVSGGETHVWPAEGSA